MGFETPKLKSHSKSKTPHRGSHVLNIVLDKNDRKPQKDLVVQIYYIEPSPNESPDWWKGIEGTGKIIDYYDTGLRLILVDGKTTEEALRKFAEVHPKAYINSTTDMKYEPGMQIGRIKYPQEIDQEIKRQKTLTKIRYKV